MSTKTTFILFALLGCWGGISASLIDPFNPPMAKTGAPGESTCGQSGCHSGGTYTGTVTLEGIPDTILAGQTYLLTLKNTSNAEWAGFQITCLDGTNTKCGALTAGSGVNVATSNNRQYARQSSPKNLINGGVSWSFSWQAPSPAPAGNTCTFYFVSLCANGNGAKSGDNVLVHNKTVVFAGSSTPTPEAEAEAGLRLYPTRVAQVLQVDLPAGESSGEIELYDAKGQSVFHQSLAANTRIDIAAVAPGWYAAVVRAGTSHWTRKIFKE